jgi:hypothetical protein
MEAPVKSPPWVDKRLRIYTEFSLRFSTNFLLSNSRILSNSSYAAKKFAMFYQRFTIRTRLPAAQAMSTIKHTLPVPTTGSWPVHATRIDRICNNTFRAFVVRDKMWPFVVSATMNQTRSEATFRVQPYQGTIVGAACVLAALLAPTLWLSFQVPSALPRDSDALSMLWQASLLTAGVFGGQVWWQSRCVCQCIRRILAENNAA